MAPNYTTPAIELVSGRGCRVTDSEGKEYLDLLAGIAVSSLGHAHPDVVNAVTAQVARVAHTSNLYANEPGLRLAERLQATTPAGHKVIFQNSGTEANEAALKIVRRHGVAQGMKDGVILAFHNSFHGRTMGAVTLTGQAHYHDGFQPLLPGVAYCAYNDPGALEEAFANQRITGVFLESIQGEGGVTPMSQDAARTLARLSSQHGALLVADEVQTGVGRTGRFYGFEHDGLQPQIITLAKGLGAGLPIGAVLIHPKTAQLLKPGAHGTTFGGNPVACAAGNAVLDVLEREALVARAGALGAKFMAELALQGAPARGRGLLVGVPLAGPVAPRVIADLRGKGILVGQAGKNVLRVAPPLVVGEEDLLGALPVIVKAIGEARAAPAAEASAT